VALWVLEASGRTPIDLPDGPLHRVVAAYWVRRQTDFGTAFLHTFLLDVGFSAPEAETRVTVESLIPKRFQPWDVVGKPAPDGTYVDLESRTAVVVRDGVIVANPVA
jgi:hypothetical protein